MLVKIERWAYTPDGVFGTLRVGDLELFTVERPWQNNIPKVSAIPIGQYPLKLGWYNRGDYAAYEVEKVEGRSLIKIHRANTMDDLLGCIGVGTDTGYIKNRWAITNSTEALDLFMKKMNFAPEGILVIVNTDSLSR